MWLSCFCLSVICKILHSTKQLHVARVETIRADHHAVVAMISQWQTSWGIVRDVALWGFSELGAALSGELVVATYITRRLANHFRPENILLSLLCLWDRNVVVSVFMNILLWLKKNWTSDSLCKALHSKCFVLLSFFLIVLDHPCSHRLKWFQFTDNRCFLETKTKCFLFWLFFGSEV